MKHWIWKVILLITFGLSIANLVLNIIHLILGGDVVTFNNG